MTANNCLLKMASEHWSMLREQGIEADEFLRTIKEQLLDIKKRIEDTGYADMPKHLYDDWVKSVQQEIGRQEHKSE